MSDEDEINIDTRVQTIQRYEIPSEDPTKNSLKRQGSYSTYSPKKKRLLEHINTEYSSGGGVLSGGDILSPTYKSESYSPQHGLLSPNPGGGILEVVFFANFLCLMMISRFP